MDFIDLENVYFEGDKYKVFLNKTDYNKVFLIKNNNKFIIPAPEKVNSLNKLYNEKIKYYFFVDDILVKEKKKSKKVINDSCVYSLNHYNNKFMFISGCLNKNNKILKMVVKSKIDSNYLYNSVMNNKNLNSQEKKLFKKFRLFIDNMIDYINNENVSKRLNTFKIKYDYDNRKKYDAPVNVSSLYDPENNTIVVFNVKKIDDLRDKELFFHELIHLLFNKGLIDKKKNIGNALNEGMTQLLTREYFDGSLFIYDNNQTYIQILCEILGADNIMKCYANNNISEFYNLLSNYISSKDEIIKFITTLDIIKVNEEMLKKVEEELLLDIENKKLLTSRESIKITLNEKYKYIFSIFREMYKIKYKTDINCDKLMIAYFDSIFNTNNLMCPIFKKDNIKQIAVEKGYFNFDYILAHPGIRIVYQYKNPVIKEVNLSKIPVDYKDEFRNSYINTMVTSDTYVIKQNERFNMKSLV